MAQTSRIAAIRAVAREYQLRLGLAHWDISVRWSTKKDEMGSDVSGQVTWIPDHTQAIILLDRTESDSELHHTVVHELLHVSNEGHKPKPFAYDPQYENSLNRIATALLASPRTAVA